MTMKNIAVILLLLAFHVYPGNSFLSPITSFLGRRTWHPNPTFEDTTAHHCYDFDLFWQQPRGWTQLYHQASNTPESNQEDGVGGLNELHTMLQDAVSEQDFVAAGRISDLLLYQLYSDWLANGSGSTTERDEKLKLARRRMSWKGLGAAPWLIHRLDALNFTFPTTIQINAMEAVNAILQTPQNYDDDDDDNNNENNNSRMTRTMMTRTMTMTTTTMNDEESLEERVGRSKIDMGIVVSGTTGSGKSLAYLVPMLSTLTDSLFARQRIRVGAEEMVGDTTGDLLDRLAIVTSPVVRSSTRSQIRSGSSIATGAALSTLGTSGTDVRSPLSLIVVPSRELGIQIAMVLYSLVGGNLKESPTEFAPGSRANMFQYKGPKGVRIGCVLDDEDAAFGLKLQTDVAITTPHYLGKLLDDGDISAAKLRVVVFDEADLALEQTSSSTLKNLFEDKPGPEDDESSGREYSRLTFLAGASVTEALGKLAVSSRILPSGRSYIATASRFAPLLSEAHDDAQEEKEPSTKANDNNNKNTEFRFQERQASLQDLNLCLYPGLKHQRATVEDGEGLLVLTRLLRKELRECDERNSSERPRVVIFFRSEEEAKAALEPLRDALWGEHRVCVLLPKTGVSPLTILDQFRRNETSVMLATPNSVRGLDVKGLTHVYTLYLPMDDPREYVHLAGRVGRVGQASIHRNGGNVISILRRNETNQMNDLAQQLGFEFTEIDPQTLKRPEFVRRPAEESSNDYSDLGGEGENDDGGGDGDDDDDLVVTSQDVESMRRYLEDSITFLKVAEDPDNNSPSNRANSSSSFVDNNNDDDFLDESNSFM